MGKIKKIMMFVIDSLHPTVFEQLTSDGTCRALRFFRDRGATFKRVVSSFPTMTPVCLASIATGTYAGGHQVPGFVWLDENKRLVNYGATPGAILKHGPFEVVDNLLYRLNQRHHNPKTPTLYERLEEKGLTTAVINLFTYRGKEKHPTKIPLSIRLASLLRLKGEVFGPKILALGDIVRPWQLHGFKGTGGITRKFGVNDVYSCEVARELVKTGQQPDFTMVYLPDTDGYAHRHGPVDSHPSVCRADAQIQTVLDAFPSWEKALDETVFIVMGDHSQSLVGKTPESIIDLRRELQAFTQLAMKKKQASGEDVALAANERMAIVYVLKDDPRLFQDVLDTLAGDYRHSQVMWKEGERCCVLEGGSGRRLTFWQGGPHRDEYDQEWSFEGELDVVDGKLEDGRIVFHDYPDAFARIQGALDSQADRPDNRRILLSCLPGHEYDSESAPIHPGGGSHGSLHREDSIVPAVIAGGDRPMRENPRVIDFVPWILGHFGIS